MALQLVTFTKTPTEEDKDRTTINVIEQNLEKVLEAAGDRPLCVVCICGPSRQGKSFILGHIIRCLDATEKKNEDWMDWENSKKPLDRGFSWQNAYGPVTQGIWMWNKPYIMKKDGREFAVILMDTQGTYDEFTSNRDMTSIVGLSLLMSSVTIFNFFTNLQEDILSSLTTYIEYGKIALESNNKETPFQKLKFLIRDWNNPSEFKYGRDGGEDFIEKKLEIKAEQPENARKVRETIKKCFQEIDCFLMPAIGEKALAKDYDGNIAALNKSFADKMQDFITNLVEDELLIKKVVGVEITSKELRNYIKIYVDAFNNTKIPSALSMWEATTMVANNNTLEKAVKTFQETFKKSRKAKRYLNPTSLKESFEAAKKKAMVEFKKTKIYGDTKKWEEDLMTQICNEFAVNRVENDKLRNDILIKAEAEAETTFQNMFTDQVQFDKDETFYEDSNLSKMGMNAKKKAIGEFEDSLLQETDDDKDGKVKILEEKFDKQISAAKTMNDLNKKNAENHIASLLQEITQLFIKYMAKFIDKENCVDVEAFQETISTEKKRCIAKFENEEKPGSEKFQTSFKTKLEEQIDSESNNALIKYNLRMKELEKTAGSIIDDLVSCYEKKIKELTDEDNITDDTESDISDDHKRQVNLILKQFSLKNPYDQTSAHTQRLENLLRQKLESVVEDAQKRTAAFKEKVEKSHREAVEKCFEIYKDAIVNVLQGKDYLPEDDFASEIEQASHEAIKKFGTLQKIGKPSNVQQYLQCLNKKIGEHSIMVENENMSKRDSRLKLVGQTAAELCKRIFEKQVVFEGVTGFFTEEEITAKVDDAKSQALGIFRQELQQEPDAVLKRKLSDLERELNDTIESFRNKNELAKKKAEVGLGAKVSELSDKYSQLVASIIEEHTFDTIEDFMVDSMKEMNNILQEFNNSEKPGSEDFQAEFQQQLDYHLNKQFSDAQMNYKLKMNEHSSNADKLLAETVAEYDVLLSDATSDGKIEQCSSQDLQALHKSELKSRISEFESNCPYKEGSMHLEKYKRKLEDTFVEIYNRKLEKVATFIANVEIKCKECISSGFEEYKANFKRELNCSGYLLDDQLKAMHEQNIKNSVKRLEQLGIELGCDVEEYISDLTAKMNAQFEDLQEENSLKRQNAVGEGRDKCSESLRQYKSAIKIFLDEIDANENSHIELENRHNYEKNVAEGSYKAVLVNLDPKSVDECMKKLVTEIDNAYQSYKEFLDLKMKQRNSAIREHLADARQSYHDEMKTRVDEKSVLDPKVLHNHHISVSKFTVEKFGSKLSTEQQKELQQHLDTSFKRYEEQNNMKMSSDGELAIGIDLGTTYCCVAIYRLGEVHIIRNSIGRNITPSYVGFARDGNETVGDVAKDNAFEGDNPENTIYDAKRMIGRRMDDSKLIDDIKFWPFKVEDVDGMPRVRSFEKIYYPEQISAKILKKLKHEAEKYLKKPVSKAVITVPAYFSDSQRQATVDAGEIAGLKVLDILNEPTAAAIAYKMKRLYDDAKKVLIYDLGGGTFDVAVLDMKEGEIDVLAVDGDTHLGGEDFDKSMMEYCAQQFKQKHGIDLFKGKDSEIVSERNNARRRLKRLQMKCEDKKKELANSKTTKVGVDEMVQGIDLMVDVSREKFNEMNEKHFLKTLEIVDKALASAKVGKDQVNDIVLVGGSTRIVKIQEMLSSHFNGKALNHTIHPDEAVAYGAAVKAAILNGAVLNKEYNFTKIQDVTPMSYGIEVKGGGHSIIIPKGSKVPSDYTNEYLTSENYQTEAFIKIFQGEDPIAKNNTKLGDFTVTGIPSALSGREGAKVEMQIDNMGILKVTATSKGGSNSIAVKSEKNRLSEAEKILLIKEEEKAMSLLNTLSDSSDSEKDLVAKSDDDEDEDYNEYGDSDIDSDDIWDDED